MVVMCFLQEKVKYSGLEVFWQRLCDELDMSQGGSSIFGFSLFGFIWRGFCLGGGEVRVLVGDYDVFSFVGGLDCGYVVFLRGFLGFGLI